MMNTTKAVEEMEKAERIKGCRRNTVDGFLPSLQATKKTQNRRMFHGSFEVEIWIIKLQSIPASSLGTILH